MKRSHGFDRRDYGGVQTVKTNGKDRVLLMVRRTVMEFSPIRFFSAMWVPIGGRNEKFIAGTTNWIRWISGLPFASVHHLPTYHDINMNGSAGSRQNGCSIRPVWFYHAPRIYSENTEDLFSSTGIGEECIYCEWPPAEMVDIQWFSIVLSLIIETSFVPTCTSTKSRGFITTRGWRVVDRWVRDTLIRFTCGHKHKEWNAFVWSQWKKVNGIVLWNPKLQV